VGGEHWVGGVHVRQAGNPGLHSENFPGSEIEKMFQIFEKINFIV